MNRIRQANRILPHAALFLFLLAVYLLTYTPRVNSSDGLAMFATAESMVRRGALDVEQIRWMDLQQGTYGLDGLLYSRKGVGVPLGLLPLTALGLLVPWFGPVGASLLFNAIITALTAVLLLTYLETLGFPRRTGLVVALTYGLATLAWPYAKSLFSDPFSGFLLLLAAWALLKMKHTLAANPRPGPAALSYAALAGLALGWNVATRYAEAIFLPVFGLLLLYYLMTNDELRLTITPSPLKTQNSKLIIAILAFAAPILLTGLSLMAFNLSRYGDPLNTGYLPSETFSAFWPEGIFGQLFSPGRGLLLYSPVLALSLWGFFPFLRRRPAEALLGLSIIAMHLLLYGKWFMWHGGYAWGPRFIIPTLPFWAMFLAPVFQFTIDELRLTNEKLTRRTARFIVPILVAASLLIQIPLLLVDFSPFLNSLLDTGLPLFARETFFQWRYSPLEAIWPFISMGKLDVAWLWQGRWNGEMLAALLTNVVVCGVFLKQQFGPMENRRGVGPAALLTTLAALVLLLAGAHRLPAEPVRAAVAALNRDIGRADAVITNGPELTEPLAERYTGRAPVLGLNNGGFPLPDDITRRLHETIAAHRQVWWLPNWLPPEQSAIEQTLLAEMVRVENRDFAGQRLVLFAAPPDESLARPMEAAFGSSIVMSSAAVPPTGSPGAALTIELRWQTTAPLDEDYHVFMHLTDAAEQVIAQADGQPGQWTRPTSGWAVGETIIDRYGLWLAAETPPGRYTLRVGLYRPADGRRLPLPSGDEAVTFAVELR
jgi:hypothetical protein